jgi:hypothetical protein
MEQSSEIDPFAIPELLTAPEAALPQSHPPASKITAQTKRSDVPLLKGACPSNRMKQARRADRV